MKILTQGSFENTRLYIMAKGRPLDRWRFEYHFDSGSAAAVVEALAAYQNEDGGFGRALEPDMRAAASSAVATTFGLTILREVQASAAEPLVKKAIGYLLDTYDSDRQVWPIIPPAVEDAPHAPWWNYEMSPQNFGNFLSNPRVCLLGHLLHYAEIVPDQFLLDITKSVLDHLEGMPDDGLSMHDYLCYLDLVEAGILREIERKIVLAILYRAAAFNLALDPTEWTGYSLRPLDVAPAPNAALAPIIQPEAIQANLDYEIEQQLPDGSWPLTWSWSDVDADAWSLAEAEWKGHLAVNKLRTLGAYGRIEGLISEKDQGVARRSLRMLMNRCFTTDEVRQLCFDLGLDYDAFAADSKDRMIVKLLLSLGRAGDDRSGLKELITLCKKVRSNVIWPDAAKVDLEMRTDFDWEANQRHEASIAHLIREERIRTYQSLWALLEPLAKYAPPGPFTYGSAQKLASKMREWYFNEGGLFLSEGSRRTYFAVQDYLGEKVLLQPDYRLHPHKPLGKEDYLGVRRRASVLRASLSEDIGVVRDTFAAGAEQIENNDAER